MKPSANLKHSEEKSLNFLRELKERKPNLILEKLRYNDIVETKENLHIWNS